MGGLPVGPEGGPGGREVELEYLGQLTGLSPGSPGGTLAAPGDDAPCAGICRGRNIGDRP